MITYPALTRSTVIKKFEFDDVRYTIALLLAMAQSMGSTLKELVNLLCLERDDVAGLIDDAPCNHALPFEAAASEMLMRFGACADEAPIPSYDSVESKAEMPALLVELVSFNSERDESAALYGLMSDGTLDWLNSDDFKTLPVPLNQVASERIDLAGGATAA